MLGNPYHYLAISAVLAVCVVGQPVAGTHNPAITPDDFVPDVDNKYFTLVTGTQFTYEDRLGTRRIIVVVTNEKKKLMEVMTTGVRVTEWRNGVLTEDTTDWYAQDKAGNVWVFGEAVNIYIAGKVDHRNRSWEAGVDGARPGIIVPADPQPRDLYRQEYLPGGAENLGTVVATDKKVTVPYGTLEKCVQIEDANILMSAVEQKYYCPAISFLALEEVADGADVELISISRVRAAQRPQTGQGDEAQYLPSSGNSHAK